MSRCPHNSLSAHSADGATPGGNVLLLLLDENIAPNSPLAVYPLALLSTGSPHSPALLPSPSTVSFPNLRPTTVRAQ
jgi:hypothetical protein